MSKLHTHLFRNTCRNAHGSNSPRLCAANLWINWWANLKLRMYLDTFFLMKQTRYLRLVLVGIKFKKLLKWFLSSEVTQNFILIILKFYPWYMTPMLTFPFLVYPASCRYCGIWVVFPDPVSPTITKTWSRVENTWSGEHSSLVRSTLRLHTSIFSISNQILIPAECDQTTTYLVLLHCFEKLFPIRKHW